MEKFEALPEEKRNQILDAAFLCFGKNGYKKTSTADIAKAAGISKAMIFHYFGTKKAMFFYLLDVSMKWVSQSMFDELNDMPEDFFDRITMLTKLKMDTLNKWPSLFQFCTAMFYEQDPEIDEEMNLWKAKGAEKRTELVLTDFDRKKFKESASPELAMELLIGYSIGIGQEASGRKIGDMSELVEKFIACADMLKRNLYKEEYL